MKLLRPEPHQANAGLRAMVSIASADGPMGPAARALLNAIQKYLHVPDPVFDVDLVLSYIAGVETCGHVCGERERRSNV